MHRLAAALWLSVAACGPAEDPRPADWRYIHAAIITPSCVDAGCHTTARHVSALDLEDVTASAKRLVGGAYVIAGQPEGALFDLLEGNGRVRMPPDAPLPSADVELIRRWVLEGAPRP